MLRFRKLTIVYPCSSKVEPCAGCITLSVTCQRIVDNTEHFLNYVPYLLHFYLNFCAAFKVNTAVSKWVWPNLICLHIPLWFFTQIILWCIFLAFTVHNLFFFFVFHGSVVLILLALHLNWLTFCPFILLLGWDTLRCSQEPCWECSMGHCCFDECPKMTRTCLVHGDTTRFLVWLFSVMPDLLTFSSNGNQTSSAGGRNYFRDLMGNETDYEDCGS